MSDTPSDRRRPPAFPVVDRQETYRTDWFTAGYDVVERPDGSTKRYHWARLADAAVVVAVHDDRLVVVEQYRPVVGETHVELPAGVVEDGESFVDAGERELREETGYVAGETRLLESFAVCTGLLRHRRGVVLATDLEPGQPAPDEDEHLVSRTIPVADALAVARRPPVNDATLEGVLLAREAGVI